MIRHRPRTLYALIRCPVLLLAATSPATPPLKRELLAKAIAAMPLAEIVEFPGGGHDLHAQHPERIAELLDGLG